MSNVHTPSLTGVEACWSSGTTLSASSKSGIRDSAASWGLSAYALKPGVTYTRIIKTVKRYSYTL